ncbi:MAG: TonB-dependent receptor [Chitinophagaceae bacterium]|nr:MAG: TonB-dependent receptor [Chitinophagaceae bacterium]
MLKRILCLLVVVFSLTQLSAQVTNSSLTGSVRDSSNSPLAGASITATHVPSGTVYQTIANKDGFYTIPAMRVGGPYKITVTYVGFNTEVYDNVTLTLGDAYNINTLLGTGVQALESVVVTGTARRATADKSGASTNINSRQLASLPTISRSITDFTRLTPQANGNNIAGRDARYNNVTVDGANLNNNFGLSSDPLPGGGSNPISLDALEEISVNIAPSDVRQSGFTGANITAVTKSGTNTFKGTAYTYFRDQSFNGINVGGLKLPEQAKTKSNLYGFSFGGPIIKNKLFFFVNGEIEKNTLPSGITYTPKGGSGRGNVSNTPIDSLRKLSDYLRSTYGYETGAYDNFPNFTSENHKILGRIDWNISKQHKLTLKYNELINDNDVAMSNSIPNGTNTSGNSWTSVPRNGANNMSFENSQYAFHNVVRSAALELNSTFRNRFSNQLIATYTKIQTTRSSPSSIFPFIDIIGDNNVAGSSYATGARNNYMSVGYEPYSYNNDVKNNIFNITDNFSYYAGKHTLTAGITYEHQYVGNQFMPASQSYYVYGSLAEFMNPAAHPISYSLTFSRVPGDDAPYSAELKLGQLGFYVQDEININSRFKITAGLRFDRPIYDEQPIENPAITALTFPDKDGVATSYSTGMWPKATFYPSPRLNFRYDVEGDKKLIVRGGTGIYTGRMPFVYLTNMPTNSGMYQFGAVANAAQLSQITFNPDRTTWQSLFTTPEPTPPTGGFVLIDKKFKFPSVWRTNLGLDKRLGNGWTVSADLLYTRDINAVSMRNANQVDPTGTVTLAPGVIRKSFAANTNASRRLYAAYNNAIVLENNGEGKSFAITPQISKAFGKGFYGSLAYTYTFSQDVTGNPGSTAASVWSGNPTSGTQNDLELSYSQYMVPHRFVANLSYRLEYFNHLASTFSFFYEGASQGSYTYIYGAASGTAPTGFTNTADVNFDGNSSDLMYIPKSGSELTFVPVTINGITYSAAEQVAIWDKYVEQDPYLKKHKGQVAERNGARYPFYHRVDFRYLQDIFVNIGSRRNTLQLSFDCTNFLNLLNNKWGVRDFYTVQNPLRATKNATTGEVRYQLGSYVPGGSSTPQIADKTFIDSYSTSSTYSMQVGLRYIF